MIALSGRVSGLGLGLRRFKIIGFKGLGLGV